MIFRSVILTVGMLMLMCTGLQANTLKPAVYKQLTAIHKAYDAADYDAALQRVNKLLEARLSAYAKAQSLQMLGSIQLAREEYQAALDGFAAAHQLKQLTSKRQQQLLHSIAQLSYQTEQWQRSISNFNSWLKNGGKASANDYMMLAQSYTELKDWPQVVTAARKAIALHPAPQDGWYQIQLVAHWRLQQFAEATKLLKVLVTRQPQNTFFWQQLAYGYQQQNDDQAVLTTLRGAYVQGVLMDTQYINWLVQLLIQEDSPQRAGEILQESLASGRLKDDQQTRRLALQAALLSRDFVTAVPLLERFAASTGEQRYFRQLAQIHLQLQQWQPAYAVLADALQQQPANPGELYIMQGMASLNAGRSEQARQSFEKAAKYASSEDSADSWLSYLNTVEQQNLAAIAAVAGT